MSSILVFPYHADGEEETQHLSSTMVESMAVRY